MKTFKYTFTREPDAGGWINKHRRLPRPEDTDDHGCVLVWHVYQGCMVQGRHSLINNGMITHWQPLPKPPAGMVEATTGTRKKWR